MLENSQISLEILKFFKRRSKHFFFTSLVSTYQRAYYIIISDHKTKNSLFKMEVLK